MFMISYDQKRLFRWNKAKVDRNSIVSLAISNAAKSDCFSVKYLILLFTF